MGTEQKLDVTPERVLDVLQMRHTGALNGVTVKQLASEVVGTDPTPGDERNVRHAVSVLREQGQAVCAHPKRGYFLAANSGEINETCEFLYARAMHTLKQVAALKNKALPDLRGQMGLGV